MFGTTTAPDGDAASCTLMACPSRFVVSVRVSVAYTAFGPAPSPTDSGYNSSRTPGTSSSRTMNSSAVGRCPAALARSVYAVSACATSFSGTDTSNSALRSPAAIVTVEGHCNRDAGSPARFTVSASAPAKSRDTNTCNVPPSRTLAASACRVSPGTSSSTTVNSASAPSYPAAETDSTAVRSPSNASLSAGTAVNAPTFAPAGIVTVAGTATSPGRELATATSSADASGPVRRTTHRTPAAPSATRSDANSSASVFGISVHRAYSVRFVAVVTVFVAQIRDPPFVFVHHPANSHPSLSTSGNHP